MGSRPGLHSVLNKDETHVENGNESPWETSRFSGKESRSHSLTPHTRVYLSSQLGAEVGNLSCKDHPQILEANLITSHAGLLKSKSLGPIVQTQSSFNYFNPVFKISDLLH